MTSGEAAASATPTVAQRPSTARAASTAAASEPNQQVRDLVTRYFFGTVALVAFIAGAMFAFLPPGLPPLHRVEIVGGYALLLVLSLAATRARAERLAASLIVIAVAAIAMITFVSTTLQWGLSSPAIGFFAVITCLVCAVAGIRPGLLVAAGSVAALATLAAAEQAGIIAGAAAAMQVPMTMRLIIHGCMLLAGLSGGLLLSHVVGRHVDASAEREQRFRGLLWIAADAYWEMDASFNLVAMREQRAGARGFVPVRRHLGKPPWEMRQLQFDDDTLDAHRADLENRRPFRDVPLRWRCRDAGMRHILASGEPRFDARGVFTGYWGVARDATEEMQAHHALAITENRNRVLDHERQAAEDAVRRSEALLSHLFATSPDVISLTDLTTGRYAMVNEMFCRMSGYRQDEAIGRTSADLNLWADEQDRARLLRAVQQHGSVANMPAAFNNKGHGTVLLLVSAARFVMDGRDYLVVNARDITETERTRKEHEAILQNASIGIAFTRHRRFVQANVRCEQMFGWPAGELSGQSTGTVWARAADYDTLERDIGPALGAGQQVEVEQTMRRRDGSQFICRIIAKAVDPAQPRSGGTIWILDDVTERRMMDQALAKARDDAEAASRAKSAFLANTSHELRTPLNGLVGLTRLARQPDVGEAQRGQYLDQIADSADILSSIINDILDLSKIEAGKLHIESLAFDLHALLRALQRAYGTLAEARGLGFSVDIDPDLPQHVLGDPVRVRQILSNYLANALKFTPHGSVRLAAIRGTAGATRFEVTDTGPGITEAVRERLFQPFMQADQSTTRRFGGTGLGLSICFELAALLGGSVGVTSESGQGSVFWVELPLQPTDAREAGSGYGALDGSGPMAGARVLMVEDNPVNMMIGVALLEQWGIKVTQALTGVQAIEAVQAAVDRGHPFDAVLMDVQMPEMSGHEATRILRRSHDAASLPIIALTAAALVSEREQALEAGMNDFLTKPIDAQRLRTTLTDVLEQRVKPAI